MAQNSFPLSIKEFLNSQGETVGVGSKEAEAAEQHARSNDRNHVFHSWSAQAKINPLPIAKAEGAWIYDYSGKGYLDAASQLVSANLGHGHPALVAAITTQLQRVSNLNPAFANDSRGELAAAIIDKAQGEFSHIFFTNGGADAVEHAIRMARKHTGRSKILTAYRSYHGATGSAIMATGEARRHGNPTTDGDIKHFWGPFHYRSAFHAKNEQEECERALQHLEDTIDFEDDVAAVLIESVVGSSGVIVPPEGYLAGVREICDRKGILWIADEVMVGFGRTGKLFAYEHAGKTVAHHNGPEQVSSGSELSQQHCTEKILQPDIVTFAKGVNAGIVPLGGVMMTAAVKATFDDTPYPGGLTYSGHPVACAPGVAALEVYEKENIFDKVAKQGEEIIEPRLNELVQKHNSIGNVRGKGFFWAIEFVADQDTKAPLGPEGMAAFGAAAKEAGVWPMVSGNRVHLAPPLVTSVEELKFLLDVVDAAATEADKAL
ncbi:aminotransferase class III-fold pyridoxal phosphate-dependent enzyme [Corynebacterium anserum]|uniref:Aminotransferase class III-fold pyridoxal phosphate-dependent enzyme n=1 Tax=Corynebacterium anserum TaxID=2684406 RepID=A0A7G7YMN8_9CORY|nr:aminotransferase class III-fold pyridoxal phosphate-dependent enzyme [Corynebacterium anserum]QNH95758.1 aminotransferase class III-fold pyridoxal phosphate-dependent enzyme [Corynebacterium anserum]